MKKPKELRPYQLSAKSKLGMSLRAGNKRVVFYCPTGGGKSISAVDLIAAIVEKGKKVAFIANRIGLVQQFSEHLTEAGIHHGIIRGEETFNIHAQVVVCSIQTVARRGLPETDYCIVDEAHACAGSNDYKKVMFGYNNIYWIGLTATPFSRGMAKVYPELGNEPLFQDMVIAATIQELIGLGNLVDCDIYAPTDPDLSGVKLQRNSFGEMDYNEKQLGAAVDKESLIGDIVTHWFKLASKKKTVVFATNVAHSRHIVEEFIRCGVKAEHIDGYMDPEEKAPILERFKRGDTRIISNVSMLKEGWDVPECECMILARPTRSLISFIQMCGRVLRSFPGKTVAIVIDHSGSVHKLGSPTDDLPLELCDGTAKKSKQEEKKEDAAKKDKKCPKCSLIKKSHTCSNCGFTPETKNEVETVEGDLSKVEKKKKFHQDDKQAIWSESLGLGKLRGWTEHRCAQLYKSVTGVFPRSLRDVATAPSDFIISQARKNAVAYRQKMERGEA